MKEEEDELDGIPLSKDVDDVDGIPFNETDDIDGVPISKGIFGRKISRVTMLL